MPNYSLVNNQEKHWRVVSSAETDELRRDLSAAEILQTMASSQTGGVCKYDSIYLALWIGERFRVIVKPHSGPKIILPRPLN
jgi:hypothetical protein